MLRNLRRGFGLFAGNSRDSTRHYPRGLRSLVLREFDALPGGSLKCDALRLSLPCCCRRSSPNSKPPWFLRHGGSRRHIGQVEKAITSSATKKVSRYREDLSAGEPPFSVVVYY